MAKRRTRDSNPVAGGRPSYDTQPVQNIPRAEGDPTGQSASFVAQQQGAPLAKEAEQGVVPSGAQENAAAQVMNLPDAFGPSTGGSIPVSSSMPAVGPALSMQSGLSADDVDLLLEEINAIVPSYETAALTRRGQVSRQENI